MADRRAVVRLAPYGRGAVLELQAAIEAAQRDDPMAAVTVVVARRSVGLATRRRLAGLGEAGGPLSGVRNVRFLTLADLAGELAGPSRAGKDQVPLTEAALTAAIRRALGEQRAGVFGDVGQHPATLRAFARTYRDLRSVSPESLEILRAQNARAAAVVDLCTVVRERLATRYDDGDLLESAGELVRGEPAGVRERVGVVIGYLLGVLSPSERSLLSALEEASTLDEIVGVTGDAEVDDEVIRQHVGSGPSERIHEPVATEIVSAPSADVEVLVALRAVMEWRHEGVALSAMAIGFAGNEPYPRLVAEALTSAQIPFHGLSVRRLSATTTGRVLLGAFELAERDWRRGDMVAWWSTAPIMVDGHHAPTSRWDEVSREAGIVSGMACWQERLGGYLATRRAQLELDVEREDEYAERDRDRTRRAVDHAASLLGFVASMADRFAHTPSTWRGWAEWAARLLDDTLGVPAEPEWPREEIEAYTACREAIGRIGDLDAVDPSPTLRSFRSALSVELDTPAPQTARFGDGVQIARVGQLAGLEFERVILLGVNDGVFPSAAADDPLLPDAERGRAGDVVLRAERRREDRRAYLAVLQGAQISVLSFARGNQANGRVLRPARWLLDSLEPLVAAARGEHRTLYSSDIAGLGPVPGFAVVPSYFGALKAPGDALSLADWDLRELLEWRERGEQVAEHPLAGLVGVFGRAITAQRARRSRRFTRFDGHVQVTAIPTPRDGSVLSPSALESYATCPRRYLFARALRVRSEVAPEDVIGLEARERGNLVHRVLERFIGETLATGEPLSPDHAWDDSDRARLSDIAEEVFEEFSRAGLLGRPLLWGLARVSILRELDRFLEADSAHRREHRAVPHAVELQFGRAGEPPIHHPVSGGGSVHFSGIVDRVDTTADGAIIVIDYKTGSSSGFKGIAQDPVLRGTKLQLPIYAMAARQYVDASSASALYWFTSARADEPTITIELDDATEERFADALGTIVEGIEQGQFPGRPGKEQLTIGFENCTYCDFDSICGSDRERVWNRKRQAPSLAGYVELAEPSDAP